MREDNYLEAGRSLEIQEEKLEEGLPFDSLKDKISYKTLKAITVKPMQFTHMSPVQEAVLSLLPEIAAPPKESEEGKDDPPRDLLVRAKTGTGKTLAFLVPAIEARLNALDAEGSRVVRDSGSTSDKRLEIRAKEKMAKTTIGALILSPTRELATQIASEAIRLTHHHEGFEVRLLTGGISKRMQMRDWSRGRLDIVVATTGRLRDLMQSEPRVVEALKGTRMVRVMYYAHKLGTNLTIAHPGRSGYDARHGFSRGHRRNCTRTSAYVREADAPLLGNCEPEC